MPDASKTDDAPPVRVLPVVRCLARILARTIEAALVIGGAGSIGFICYLAILGIVAEWAKIRELALPAITVIAVWVIYRTARHYEDT